jgi:uncharacterized protein
MLHEIWPNFTHNLFKPLLLFFYLGFLIPILRVRFEFPYVIYQGLSMYLLLAIGWHGGQELAEIDSSTIGGFAGLMVVGFVLNFVIGAIAYSLLNYTTALRRIDSAMVAGYYGSDSAGTYLACVGILTGLGLAFNAYMPVLLAVMEIPGCLVALYLAGRLRGKWMDAAGFMPDEPGYTPLVKAGAGPSVAVAGAGGENLDSQYERGVEQEFELSMEKREHPDWEPEQIQARQSGQVHTFSRALLREVFFNPGLGLLVGGIVIGFISELQGAKVVQQNNTFFVSAFQGALCLFLLEMGMTASRKLRDLRSAGIRFIIFALLIPNVFAAIGIGVAHTYAHLTHSDFKPGTYILFAVLCASASYITVPAVQRLAIPEASPTLPLAASLGLTFSYNVTIGIPVYIEIARLLS